MAQSIFLKMALFYAAILADSALQLRASVKHLAASGALSMGMSVNSHSRPEDRPARVSTSRQAIALSPALAALIYPALLETFHAVVTLPGAGMTRRLFALPLLLTAFLPPALGVMLLLFSAHRVPASSFERRARVLALLSIASPPLFVFTAFLLSVLGHPVPETWAWSMVWFGAGLWTWAGRHAHVSSAIVPPAATPRVIHGVIAGVLLLYICLHLSNHVLGLFGPETHASFMIWARHFYRPPAAETALVALLLCQLVIGGWLASRWSLQRMDGYRVIQVATGVYLGFFLLTHMNSALVSARALQGIDTNWAWASGAPSGLIADAWNIRLVPHYALGVFCVLAHLTCGLRAILLAHDWESSRVNRLWIAGLIVAGVLAATILSALCGLRIPVGIRPMAVAAFLL